jgi:transposase
MLNGIFWIARSGAAWRDLPERYGPWQTVYGVRIKLAQNKVSKSEG